MSPATPPGAPHPASPERLWWVHGVALHERGRPPTGGTYEQDPAFATRLADLGLSAATELDEAPEALAARIARPAWVGVVLRVLDRAHPLPIGTVIPLWSDAFGRVLDPFVDDAVGQVRAAAPAAEQLLDADSRGGVAAGLRTRLVRLAARTLVTELHRWRAEGRLEGATPEARFQDFIRLLTAADGLREVLERYPVLARLLADEARRSAEVTVEVLERFDHDRAALVDTLLDGTDPGPVVGILDTGGDRHGGGRSVAFVDLADGRRLVHKPRDLRQHVVFADAIAQLHEPGLFPRTVRVLPRGGYGWAEYVATAPLADAGGADCFYRRLGALAALLHVLRGTDVHFENLVAQGDHPVLIDIETLFQPSMAAQGSGDPAADALASSVLRTALLPVAFVGERGVADLSGVGRDGGTYPATVIDWQDAGTDRMRLIRRPARPRASGHRPFLDGRAVAQDEHTEAMVDGFRRAYDVISVGRARLDALVREHADLEVRVVMRPTWIYATLLDETTHPDVLRDAVDRDRAFAVLYDGRAGNPLFAQLLRHEVADLWAGDVPLFTASPATGQMRSAAGVTLPQPLPQTGSRAALDVLDGLGEIDRRDQEWVVTASLAMRSVQVAGTGGPSPAHPEAGAVVRPLRVGIVSSDELLAAACGVADQIVAAGITDGTRVNWLGLEAVDEAHWLVMPLGAGLGGGYLGVAVFLAQLAAVTGIARYADHARYAVRGAPAVVASLRERPDLVAAVGCGGMHGLSGIAYGLGRLGVLLDEARLVDIAATAVVLAADAVTPHAEPGWAGGLAGCVAALGAVNADLGLDGAAEAARRSADLLLESHVVTAARADHPVGDGFAEGLAGVAWALATSGPDDQHTAAGRQLAARLSEEPGPDDPRADPGWCRGAAGRALTALLLADQDRSATTAWSHHHIARRDLSLCHGELGIAEVLGVLTSSNRADDARALQLQTGLVLAMVRRYGPLCGVPRNVATPGLLTGLAGIGYGLLRLAVPHRVPSVLLLERLPTTTPSTEPHQ